MTPIVIGFITFLFLSLNLKLIYRIIFIALAIIINDILIKLFAGGTHDSEGEGWITLFLILGLIISTIIAIIKISIDRKHKLTHKIIFITLLPTLVGIYLSYFNLFGLSYYEQGNDSKDNSLKNKTFIKDLVFSHNTIIYENDSLNILYGWMEKQRKMTPNNILEKNEETANLNYTIKISHNLKPYNFSVYYKVNSEDVNGASPVDSIIQFSASKLDSNIYISFFKLRESITNDTLIKKIQIR